MPDEPTYHDSTVAATGEAGDARRLPPWLRVKTGKARQSRATHDLVAAYGLHTVCEGARCPNIGECYCQKTATFMVMGARCTRDCRFCAVEHGTPCSLEPDEPQRVAAASAALGLRYVVVTSVTRDDLPDGGASHFAATIHAVRETLPHAKVEVLTPDFRGDETCLHTVLQAGPDVFNHNVETVRRLQARVRPQASYETSLEVLRRASAAPAPMKSGLMVGLGETGDEIRATMDDLAQAGVVLLTIGQYLRPTRRHVPVARYVPPEEFGQYVEWGKDAGIAHVFAGPFVRSSYRAAEAAAALERR